MADGPPPTGEHAGSLNRPAPFDVNLTLPVGVPVAPGASSLTLAVHVEGCPIATVAGEQLTLVDVGTVTVSVCLSPLCKWVESPP